MLRVRLKHGEPVHALSHAGVLVLAGLIASAALAYVNDGDLAWQRALGEHVLRTHGLPATLGPTTFSAPDARWFPHEWIFATVWALAERNGLEVAFRFGCALTAFGAVSIAALRTRHMGPRVRMIAVALVVAGILPSFGGRAQILAWPLLACLMLTLEAGPRRVGWVLPIAVIWYNLHASALIVPVIVLLHGAGRALDERRAGLLVPTLGLTSACVLASALSPFGFAYAPFAAAWTVNPATNLIAEWQPVTLATLPDFSSAFIIAALLIAGELRGARLSWSQRLLALSLFIAADLHVRNLALFCIVAGPWVAPALSALLPREVPPAARMSRSDRGLVAMAALGAFVIAAVGAAAPKQKVGDPAPAVAELVAGHRAIRVACEDFSWCSRFAATPQIRVFLDGRVDAYPERVFSEYRRMLAGDAAQIFDRWQINAVLAHRDGALARSLREPYWRRLQDGATQLFVRV